MDNVMFILTLNSGSSSLKFAIFNNNLEHTLNGSFERVNIKKTEFKISDSNSIFFEEGKNHKECLAYLIEELKKRNISIIGVGHRVVHGGDLFSSPQEINESLLNEIKSLSSLAPLHQPHNIAGIEAVNLSIPNIKQVAVFDTAFHTTVPIINKMLPLPRKYFNEKVKSYGFHGLSYDYISRQEEVKKYSKVVIAHLGNGSSACALLNNKSYATTMGFTAIDGLMMGTRTGSIDPGVVLHLIDSGLSSKEVSDILYKKSGLLGVSGKSSDIRDLIELSKNGDKYAEEALLMYADKAAAHILRLASLMRGMDALVFTAGIGENDNLLREMISERLEFIGLEIDQGRNKEKSQSNRKINSEKSKVDILIIPTNEEWIIAEAVKNKILNTY